MVMNPNRIPRSQRLIVLPMLLGVAMFFVRPCQGQEQDDLGEIVDGLSLTDVSAKVVRLRWTGPTSVECESSVTYSVFRSTSDDFTPSLSNRIATGVTKTTYLAVVPVASKEYSFQVTANVVSASCELHSGEMSVYPLDLRQSFYVTVGDSAGTCTAATVTEISCPKPLYSFHAVIARQGGHEFLIGCQSADFEDGGWTCVNLTIGTYRIAMHSQTLTVLNSGIVKINTRTGKELGHITPTFSVLARIS